MIKLRCSLALLLAMLLALGGAAAWADGALVLPQRLTEIEEEAFFGDTSLDYVIVPEGVHKIGERAFANSSVQTGYLPGTLGEIPDSAFANAPLRCVITPGGSEAGRWAEARGIHVAYNNELSVMPQDNNWWVYARYGDTADLHVFCQGQDLEGSSLSWYRIETDNNGMDDWIDLDRHEFSLTTEPVEGHLRYVCRLTDRFGFQNDAWFDVMVDNGLELWSENGSDRVCVPNGEGATLRVGFRANDTDGLCFQWYQVEQDENGFDRWTELEGKTETEYITPAVTGQAQYVCRMTDRFGSMRDFWFRVSIAAQESAVSASAAYNVSGTTALIPLTYSVTAELAEQGYRMGVLYTEIPGGLLPDENGRYENAYEWTWGGESGVYGPANAVDYDGWLDELIPGHIYNYVACIVNEEHDVVVVDDHPRHFTTTDGSKVCTLTLDERIAVAADNAKTPFRFVLPTDGVYSLNANVPMDEMSVRRTDDQTIARANEKESVSFYGTAGETLYLFVRDHVRDAEVWISAVGAAPEQSSVSSDEPDNVGAVTAGVPVTYSISESMARDGYRVGVAFSTNRDDLLGLNEDGRFNCAMWDWDYLNSVEVNKTVYRWIDTLCPGTHYYLLAYISVNDRVEVYEPAENIKELTTAAMETLPAIGETDWDEVNWTRLQQNERNALRFTADRDGIYGLIADRQVSELGAIRAGRTDVSFDNETDLHFFAAHAGDTVVLFVRDWNSEPGAMVRYFIDLPTENSVSSEIAEDGTAVGSTWLGLDVTFDAIEEIANNGYRVGVAFGQNREDLELDEQSGRFFTDMWDWDDMYEPANDAVFYRHLDQLIPDSTYYYRAFISVFDRVIICEDIHEVTTGSAEAVTVLAEDSAQTLKRDELAAFCFTAEQDGLYELSLSDSIDQIDVRRSSGQHIGNGNNERNGAVFYAASGETVYLYLRTWDSGVRATVSFLGEAPEHDAISTSQVENVELFHATVELTLDITAETAEHGYGYGIEFSPNENFRDDYGNDYYNDYYLNDSDEVKAGTQEEHDLWNLVPGVTYYYRGFIDYHNGERLREEEVKPFTAMGGSEDVALLTLGVTEAIEDNGFHAYRYTADVAGIYYVECLGMNYINISGEDGMGRVGSTQEENENRYAVLGLALNEGETVYINLDSNGGAELTLGMGPGPLPAIAPNGTVALSDNRIVTFTAPEAGWYTFSVDQPRLGGLNFYNTWYHSWVGLPLGFNADATSLPLEQGEVMYLCSWYDMNRGTMHLTVSPAISPEGNAIASSNLELGDTWAQMELTFSVTAETLDSLYGPGYDAGIAYSRFESFEDENGNYQGDEWGWDSLWLLANDYTMTRTLDRLVPGTTYYYYAYLRDNNTGEYLAREETKSFTTDDAGSITSLTLGTPVTPPYDGSSVFRFQADEAGIYALVYCGIDEIEVRNASGNWITSRGYDNLEIGPDTGLGFLAGEGEEFYIFVFNGDPDAFLAVENWIDALPALTVGEWSEELWGRQVVTFTAPEDGWYRFDIRSNWYGHIHFASLEYGWDEPMESDDSATRYLKAGETVYPGSWFDDDMARVSYKVTAVTPVEEASVTTLDVSDIGDVSAHFGLRYGIPELPELEGWYYNVGVLLRADDDPGFAGGDSWTEVYADRSMVNWHRSAPSELRELSFGDNLPLLPDTTYCYEAFIEFYNEETGEAGTYFGGLKRFTTAELDREVTSVTAGEEIEVPWREDGEYQMFSFTVPEDPVDVYAFTVYDASAWVANAQGDVIWPMDVFNGGRRCFMAGNGHAGETYTIYLKVWNGEGIRFTIEERPAQQLELGVNNDIPLYTFLRFTVPETGDYLVANTDSHIFVVRGDGNRGFNYLNDSDWYTGPLETGDTVLFFLVNDDGHFEEGQTATVAIVKTDGISVATEEELRRTLDAVTVLSSRGYVDAEVSVDGAITLTDNLILSPAVILTLNAPLTVPSGITFTNESDIIIPTGGSLTVQSGASLVMVNHETWVATILVDGGTLTVDGSFTPTSRTNTWILPDHYDGIEEQMAAVSGIAPADLALSLVVGDDASLETALARAQSYHSVELILAEGYTPAFAAIETFPGNVEVVLSEGAALVVPAGETLTLNSRFTVQGGTLTVNGTVEVNTWLYLNKGSFINNGTFLLNSGGIAWPDGICAIENHGTMTLAEGSRFVLYSYDYSEDELSAVVTNTGTVNLYADVTGNVRFEGSGTVNESEA